MSKYIIELEDDIQYLVINGKANNRCYTLVRPVAELEMLNSDYINEHYGELQDEAYQKGYEDGKKSTEKGCEGCKYEGDESRVNPCCECARACDDHYIPKPSDRIEVGDEVIAPSGKAIVTATNNSVIYYLYSGGDFGCIDSHSLKKTGKRYDIQSILEAMRK